MHGKRGSKAKGEERRVKGKYDNGGEKRGGGKRGHERRIRTWEGENRRLKGKIKK